jgi:hypothetical protein
MAAQISRFGKRIQRKMITSFSEQNECLFVSRGVARSWVVGWWPGPGVAWPKSRLLGCDPAALAAQSFPYCPPGSLTWA